MPEDSDWSLIPHPGSGLSRNESAGRRIISEMVSGALDVVKRQETTMVQVNLTAELWFQRGEACYYGWNEPQNYEEAAKCYRFASDKGHLDAHNNLGCMLILGLGVCQNHDEANRLFWRLRIACEDAGRSNYTYVACMLNLSFCYMNGIGTDRDESQGFFLSYLVSKLGKENSQDFSSIQYPAERTEKMLTCFQIVNPEFDPTDTWPLRKIQLVPFESFYLFDKVLAVDGGDCWVCGDLVDHSFFVNMNKVVPEEGGMPARGLVFRELNQNLEYPEGIIGSIIGNRVVLPIATKGEADSVNHLENLQYMSLSSFLRAN